MSEQHADVEIFGGNLHAGRHDYVALLGMESFDPTSILEQIRHGLLT